MTRILGMWLPDWPIQAARFSGATGGAGPQAPIAVLSDATVAACSDAARRAGVRRGQGRRHAQAACPDLIVVDADPARDAREFEPVLDRIGDVAAGVEALRPGLVVLGVDGPAKYHGGEAKTVEMLLDAAALAGADCLVGIADDVTTAVLAARRGVQLPVGGGPAFLRGVSLAEVAAETALDFPAALGRAWVDLGLRTLGDVADLPARDVAGRFGTEGARWRKVAAGELERRVAPRTPPRDLAIVHRPEETLTRVDAAAFIARALAAKLHHRLREHGLACHRLAVTAEFTDGAELRRVWRCAGPLDEAATADRVRWQLDGWLTGRAIAAAEAAAGTTAQTAVEGEGDSAGPVDVVDDAIDDDAPDARGIAALTLEPLEVIVAGVERDALWGGADAASERAGRAAARVQGLLGPEAVRRPVDVGGRGPSERVAMVPVGEEAPPVTGRWPGALPAPNPAVTPGGSASPQSPSARHPASKVGLHDAAGDTIAVTGRGTLTGVPAVLRWGGRDHEVTAWAGPWPVDERWWTPDDARRAARMHVAVDAPAGAGGRGPQAFLLIGHAGKWRIEGRYG
ncbi:Y-family DNA polymerase [Corynebacterium freneyi]|uniref:Protein ImuB n=1 Tax=Corynebacterium freneyi TaxID=134034 RepID=A0ABS4UAG1_9CORY|nr:DNA polymerase Y family protein [Corynebacterium freneyi]MBP2333495.1 protein ImuB [Corynebacterium freneyi]MCG7440089.1 DNA polymerase Y family protein [Corynebacterium freneyi]WJZ04402.1 DNA polymerase IV [Corynebacterium freneyi]